MVVDYMSNFADEIRRRANTPPETQPIQSRTIIEEKVNEFYDNVKWKLQYTYPINGVIRHWHTLLLSQNDYCFGAGINEDYSHIYQVRGRRAELTIFLSSLKEHCASDGIDFHMIRDSEPAYRHLRKRLDSVDEILYFTGINPNAYHAEFCIKL